jgi:hypothetical protein
MMQRLRRLIGRTAVHKPFVFEEVSRPDEQAAALFTRCFKAAPPDIPRHFVARFLDHSVRGYVHLMPIEPGVFLVGGLCVDVSIYRALSPQARKEIAKHGSLSRWLLAQAIEMAGTKRAVFAYTGDTMSRRDCAALGFVDAAGDYLVVQWHNEPGGSRDDLIRRIDRIGPF